MCKLQPNYAYTVNSVCCRFLCNQCVHYATCTTCGHMLLQKNLSAFKVNSDSHQVPFHLYNSIDSTLPSRNKHELWLTEIHKVVGGRILNEEDRVPSITALWRHWLRSCWTSQLWHNSSVDVYTSLPIPEESGWNESHDGYTFDWEAPEI